VTVMVYNIHAGRDAAGADNLERVAEMIERVAPDVVLLQEVDRLTERAFTVDQAVMLAGLTHKSWAFGRSLDFQGGMYGIATLSRWPVQHKVTHPLPVEPPSQRADGSLEPRVALEVELQTPSGVLRVINTHLDASPGETVRLQEVEALMEVVAAKPTPVWLGGDLNAEPDSEVVRRLRAAGFVDAHAACGVGVGLTYPSAAPTKRIDYLWIPPTTTCTEARVLEDQASDHRALVVRLMPTRSQ